MSDDLYRTRLRWCAASGHGLLKHFGVAVELQARPPVLLHIQRLIDLDFAPDIQVHQVQEAADARRELTAAEIDELNRWLRIVAAAARQCTTGGD